MSRERDQRKQRRPAQKAVDLAAVPMEPDEFIFALRLGDSAYGLQMPMRSPAEMGPFGFDGLAAAMASSNDPVAQDAADAMEKAGVITRRGKTFAIIDSPLNRYGMALAKHFRGQDEKFRPFVNRHFALCEVLRTEAAKHWGRDRTDGNGREYHPAVFHVAATIPYTPGAGGFDVADFFRRVKELAASMRDD